MAWDFGDWDEEDGVGGVDAIVGEALGKSSKFVGGGVEPDVASGGIRKEVTVFHRSAGVGVGDGGGVVRLRTQVVVWFNGRTRTRGWCQRGIVRSRMQVVAWFNGRRGTQAWFR